ncbi:MAG TPA: hypothetical protein VLS89_14365 [Candidatus Nanopelagicales bacterium]|nr:hypothetical protein [Candidatus Nanopelagicales bacterium]
MSLNEVLKQRSEEKEVDLDEYKEVVTTLIGDIRKWVEELPFELEEWSMLVQHVDKRLNLPAITIHFKDDQVTVQPRSFLAGRRPQVEVSSGARAALLEYVGASGWMYSWEGVHGPLTSLTKETFRDVILAELLR